MDTNENELFFPDGLPGLSDLHDLFDLSGTLARPLFEGKTYPWEILPELKAFIAALGPTLPRAEYEEILPGVFAAKDATVAATASITGPCVIGHGTEIRHCAFIRGSALIGNGAVVGNSTELKNCVLFDRVQVPHYNYVGDSILGVGAHMGAGAVTSNVKSDKRPVTVHGYGHAIPTGLKKMGAILGDGVEVGCGSVLNPGTVLGRGCRVYPLSSVRGLVPPHSIYKNASEICAIEDDR